MKIIALRGKENSGKSHVINIVYQFLLNRGFVQITGNFRVLGNFIYDDIIDILEKDGIKIGIIGTGDYEIGPLGLKNLLKELEKKNCDFIVCACRTNPKIEKAIITYLNYIWVDKTLSIDTSNDRITNNTDANKIINLLL